MTRNFEDVVDRLQSYAGHALHPVIVYDGEDHRDLYRRKDDTELHGSGLKAAIRTGSRQRTSDHADEHEGRLRAIVRLFDERVIVHPRPIGPARWSSWIRSSRVAWATAANGSASCNHAARLPSVYTPTHPG